MKLAKNFLAKNFLDESVIRMCPACVGESDDSNHQIVAGVYALLRQQDLMDVERMRLVA